MGKSVHEINKRILNEIDAIEADEKQKQLLKEIVEFELENIDRESPRFAEDYKNIITKIYK